VTAALAALAFAARLACGLALAAPPVWDGVLYHRGAVALARGLGYSCYLFGPAADPSVPTAFYPVGYPAFLSVFYRLFGESPAVVVVAGALLGALTVALVHRLALRAAPPAAAHLAALAVALAPGSVVFATTPMSETLYGALLLAAIAALAPAVTARRLIVAGALLAAAAYVRPQALLLAPLLPALLAGSAVERLRRAALVTATVAALVAPWTLRNCRALDGCAVVSTNGGSNLAIGAVPRATGQYLTLTRADGCGGVVGERARERCWQRVAVASVRAGPTRWLRLAWPKLYATYANETFPADYLRESRPQRYGGATNARLRDLMTRAWWPFWIVALAGLVPLPRRAPLAPAAVLCLGAVVATTLTHLVVFGGDRYHLPMVGLFAVLSAATFRGFGSRPQGGGGRRADLPRSPDPERERGDAPAHAPAIVSIVAPRMVGHCGRAWVRPLAHARGLDSGEGPLGCHRRPGGSP
jgi:4-amino-4-deoxy-L-arabinose transferase-like glycosyltransferase